MKKLSLNLFLGLALAALSPLAARADQKTYHAAFCKAANGVETEFNRSEYRITKVGGSASNALLCPIVHDVFGCSGVFGCVVGMTATVKVFDYHTGGDVACSLTARNESGSGYWWKTASTSFAPGAATLTINGTGQWADLDTYLLKCTLPINDANGYAKIFSYMIDEWD